MAPATPQSFANHTRWVPLYHFVLSSILLVNLVWSLFQAYRNFSWPTLLAVLMALAYFGLFFFMRIFALTAQDRIIRLEMQLRLERLLAADLKPRISGLTKDQFISLRFASDAELPALVREVLEKNITDRKEIKSRIRDWQADHLRV